MVSAKDSENVQSPSHTLTNSEKQKMTLINTNIGSDISLDSSDNQFSVSKIDSNHTRSHKKNLSSTATDVLYPEDDSDKELLHLDLENSLDYDKDSGASVISTASGTCKLSIRQRFWKLMNGLLFSYAGVKLLLLAQVFNATMITFTRLLETTSDPPYHPFQILFARMLITYIGSLCFMAYRKVPHFLLGPPGVRILLIMRGVLGFFGVFGLYYSVNYLELSDAAVITFLTPTVTAVFAWYFLSEPLIPVEVAGGFVALIGVVIISRPAFLFGIIHKYAKTGEEDPSEDVPEKMRIRAVIVALIGVCGASSVYIVIRKIGRRAHPLVSVSYFALWALIVSTVGLIVTPGLGFVFPKTGMQWLMLCLLGVFGFLFQFCLTAGIQRVTAGRAAAATYTLMIWTLCWEKIIWDKTPDKTSIAGGSLILGSGIIVATFKWWENRQKDTPVAVSQVANDDIPEEYRVDDDESELYNDESHSLLRHSELNVSGLHDNNNGLSEPEGQYPLTKNSSEPSIPLVRLKSRHSTDSLVNDKTDGSKGQQLLSQVGSSDVVPNDHTISVVVNRNNERSSFGMDDKILESQGPDVWTYKKAVEKSRNESLAF